ncbi:MAG: hypothetical protein MJ137_05130 [Clostridia bacterium]|nr:hypothetical protein [Clostridia bacterium]
MSIAKMKKLEVWTLEQYSAGLTSELIKLRCVAVDTVLLTEGKTYRYDVSAEKRRFEKERDEVAQAIEAVKPFFTGKSPLIKKKQHADITLYDGSNEAALAPSGGGAGDTAGERGEELGRELASLRAELSSVSAWRELSVPLGGVKTSKTVSVIGTVPSSVSDKLIEEKIAGLPIAFSQVSSSSSARFMLFMVYGDAPDTVVRRLSPSGFVKAEFPGVEETAAEYRKKLSAKISETESELKSVTDVLKDNAVLISDFEMLWDLRETYVAEAEVREKLACTSECVLLKGWIPEKKAADAEKILSSKKCAFEFSDPSEDDDVPVLLENNRFARNFEWVIGMYSLPKYGSFDPTFIMSVCYSILFSMMFSDVGYGLLMVLGGFLLPKVLGLEEKTARAFRMFGFCGIFCMVSGVLFGGYFGDLPLAIIRFANPGAELPATLALLVDPVIDPMTFMIVGLAVGFCHLIAGQVIKFILVLKTSVFDAICDYAFYWIIYAGIIMLILVPGNAGLYTAGAGAFLVILTAGRKEKNILMKPVKGLLGLYGLVNFGSDVISYARILALALSGTVLAQVFNILATFSNAPAFVCIGTPIILIVGHILNLALSALSAFVHTSRLQYVEFFGKFYEDGGRPYIPAIPSGKYTTIEK